MALRLTKCIPTFPKAFRTNSLPVLRYFSITKTCLAAEMNDPMEHATGIEKRELEQIKAGNKDPWLLDTVIKRGPGTKEQPTMIPSAFSGRIVGCSCKGNRFVNWMWLEKGTPKRCECGFWFQLKEIKPI